MPNIVHRIGIKGATPAQVYTAFSTLEGLRSWWTRHTTGDPKVGGKLAFVFPERGSIDFQVLEAEPGVGVRWRCTSGPEDWVGTEVQARLKVIDGETTLDYRHCGWRNESTFMGHCSSQWAFFLFSLKRHFEEGKGSPVEGTKFEPVSRFD